MLLSLQARQHEQRRNALGKRHGPGATREETEPVDLEGDGEDEEVPPAKKKRQGKKSGPAGKKSAAIGGKKGEKGGGDKNGERKDADKGPQGNAAMSGRLQRTAGPPPRFLENLGDIPHLKKKTAVELAAQRPRDGQLSVRHHVLLQPQPAQKLASVR
jgi:hypothetical protein